MADFGPQVRDVLRANGCRFHRQGKGDHEIWYSPITNRKFVVDTKIKSRFTAQAIMKQAGIDYKFS